MNLLILFVIILFAGVFGDPMLIALPPKDDMSGHILISPSDSAIQVTTDGLDNRSHGWGFKREKNAAPGISQSTRDLFARYDAYYLGNNSQKYLYLTFDEGYENGYTAKILDILRDNGVPAAFFITGPYLNEQKELVQRMVDEGHIVANHTINHPSMPKVEDDTLTQEISELATRFQADYGVEMPKYFRPPMGEYSERTLSLTQQLGYKTIFWSSAYVDWDVKKQKGVDNAFKMVTSQFHNGSIILLHAVSKDNADALDRIIKEAKEQGYEFKSLDEL